MATDFFYPSFGGIEEHVYNLSQILLRRGHKVNSLPAHRQRLNYGSKTIPHQLSAACVLFYFRVQIIIITHCYGGSHGVRYLSNGLKVYYLPIKVFYNNAILPTMICNVPLLRNILLREQVQVVHGHSAFSVLAHETLLVATLLGLKVTLQGDSAIASITLQFIEFIHSLLMPVLSCWMFVSLFCHPSVDRLHRP